MPIILIQCFAQCNKDATQTYTFMYYYTNTYTVTGLLLGQSTAARSFKVYYLSIIGMKLIDFIR